MWVDAAIVGLIYLAAGILQITLPIALGVLALSVARKRAVGKCVGPRCYANSRIRYSPHSCPSAGRPT